jgi:hypothetical protein
MPDLGNSSLMLDIPSQSGKSEQRFFPVNITATGGVLASSAVNLLIGASLGIGLHPASASEINPVIEYFASASAATTADQKQELTVQFREPFASTEISIKAQRNLDERGVASRSSLAKIIIAERLRSDVDAECLSIADAAKQDAVAIVQRWNLNGDPRVMFSDDGILTLQWQRDEYGVALIFAGDGMASIAFRRPGQLYAENGIEVAINDNIPNQFADAMAALNRDL